MSITYIVPTYGKPGLLTACLSTFRKFHPIDEILVVDDHGPDREDVRRIALLFDANYIRLEKNKGFSGACNAGIAASGTNLVCLVNTDIEFTTRLTERLERAFLSDPKIAVVGALLYYPDGKTIQHGGGFYRWHGTGHYGHGKTLERSGMASITGYRFYCTGALLGFDKSCGILFDETLSNDSEDNDLCLKVWQAGRRVYYDPSITAIHAEGKTRGATPDEKRAADTFNKGQVSLHQVLNRMYNADIEGIHDEMNRLNQDLHPELPRGFIRMNAVGDTIRALNTYRKLHEKCVVITQWPELFRDENVVAITKDMGEYAVSSFIDLDLAYERHRELSIQQAYDRIAKTENTYNQPVDIRATEFDWLKVRELEPAFKWDEPYVALHMGVGWPSKTFPIQFWQNIASKFIEKGFYVVAVGSRDDQGAKGDMCIDLVRRTNIHMLRAVLEHAKLFVGPDSGPLHVADGACPAIGLYTITTPEKTVSQQVTGIMTKAECAGCLLRQPTNCFYECDHAPTDPRRYHCVMMFNPDEIVEKGLKLMGVL